MKVKIKVTQEHIDRGLPGNPDSCPIALACLDAGLFDPSICGDDMSWVKDANGNKQELTGTDCINRFIDAFDEEIEVAGDNEYETEKEHVGRANVSPFEFEAELVPVSY